jgi:micrococcal nuclease
VIDGDTLVVNSERVRIANLDAPELSAHARCHVEAQRGYAAKNHAIKLVSIASTVDVYNRQGHDKYGRARAHVLIDGQDFGKRMIADGFARFWWGKGSSWC